jgi:hypothetical protein
MPYRDDGAPSAFTVNALNIMNAIAPHARHASINALELEHQKGHLACWLGWSRAERAPAYRWFNSVEEVMRYVAAIPRLITKVGDEFVTAEGEFSQLGDAGDEGAIWWLARLRAGYKTIEWRPGFPSMPPSKVRVVADETLHLMEAFRQLLPDDRVLVRGSGELARTISKIAQVTYLVPRALPSTEVWWKMFRD